MLAARWWVRWYALVTGVEKMCGDLLMICMLSSSRATTRKSRPLLTDMLTGNQRGLDTLEYALHSLV